MTRVSMLLLSAVLACAPAAERVAPERLRISAGDALLEAGTVARTWSRAAELRYVEGEGVGAEGFVLPEAGFWRFVFDAPQRSEQLAVTVTPRTVEQMTRPPQSPPGFVLGDAELDPGWIDSPEALATVAAASAGALPAGATATMLLLPLQPPQWRIRIAAGDQAREWRVDARTGRVLSS